MNTMEYADSLPLVAGLDEVGRGALAGPVVAGACVVACPLFRRRDRRKRWSPYRRIPPMDCLIADSKQLTPAERERAYAWIADHCATGIGIVGESYIDRHGIVAATQLAMLRALAHLERSCVPLSLAVDGRDRFSFPYPHESIVRGDESHPAIAAASIVAKVARDHIMRCQHRSHPAYGFHRHKGYGTAEHLRSLAQNGSCALHRLSFLHL